MKVLITGANGFIGRHLCRKLDESREISLIKASRQNIAEFKKSPDLTNSANWKPLLENVDTVIHLAARAHILNDGSKNPFQEFMDANCNATLNLARQALDAGIKKFVFFSSIGVNSGSSASEAITSSSKACPTNDYATSKAEAESQLNRLFKNSQVDLIIFRPPLVYSFDAPGNFHTLLKASKKRLPLPFGSINNKRSLLSIRNLTDVVERAIVIEKKLSDTFAISDDEILSTAEIVNALSEGMGFKSRTFKFPPSLLKATSLLLKKSDILEKICGDLFIDNSHAKKALGWNPRFNTTTELNRAGKLFISQPQ